MQLLINSSNCKQIEYEKNNKIYDNKLTIAEKILKTNLIYK